MQHGALDFKLQPHPRSDNLFPPLEDILKLYLDDNPLLSHSSIDTTL